MERKKKKCTKEQNEKPSPSAIGGDRRHQKQTSNPPQNPKIKPKNELTKK
jgi:hypothetical protein